LVLNPKKFNYKSEKRDKMKKDKKPAGIGKQWKDGGFEKAYRSLPYKMIKDARKEICRICYWRDNRFMHMLRGRFPFRIYEIEQIEKFFESHNFNAWTGENLN
jgi:hypothetical protein